MAGVRALCDEKNFLMICDEVQCGMGRTGKWWGWQNFSVKPDLFTCAKSLADGIPMGALVSNAKYADGGVLACTVGEHVVRLLPPLAMKDSDIEDAVDMMGDSLEELFGTAE